jgi:hypothetical protein
VVEMNTLLRSGEDECPRASSPSASSRGEVSVSSGVFECWILNLFTRGKII